MKTFPLPAQEIALDDGWDVVVAGAGPAGCAAAISAAELGAKVLLLERSCAPGGMGTSALVPAWCPFSDGEKQLHRGLAGRILAASKEGTPHIAEDHLDWVPIPAEHLKQVYDSFLEKAGVTVRFDTMLLEVAVEASEGVTSVEALVTGDKRGLRAVKAKVYVDTTGDADLVHRSGVPVHHGNDRGGDLMPATLCFTLANVPQNSGHLHSLLHGKGPDGTNAIGRILASGRYPEIPDGHICLSAVGPGCIGFNAGHVYQVDNTNPDSVSVAMVKGRRLAKAYRDALAEFLPEIFGDAFLVTTGALLGVRETRRIIADYELTMEDYFARRTFPDEVCRNSYFIDIHLSKEEAASGNANDHEKVVTERFERFKPGESHGIPYRSLCPRDLHNVLVAGRCIGTDRVVNGSVRIMPVCLNTGEAAGLAAVRAGSEHAGDIHAVDPEWLRGKISERGGLIH